MAKIYTNEERWLIEVKLVLDIISFVKMFHRKPFQKEVITWAEDRYKYKVNGMHNGWAGKLIKRATGDMKVRKNGRKSVFVLYEETKLPQNKLGDFIPSEMVGITD